LSPRDIIECPQLHDVVFRQGTTGTCHPGNVNFRSLIESTIFKAQLEREQQQQSIGSKKTKVKRPKQLAQDIFEERQRSSSLTDGRYLIWNNEKTWWNELTDREQICIKIEYMVREFYKASSNSNTSTGAKGFLLDHSKKKKYQGAHKKNTRRKHTFHSTDNKNSSTGAIHTVHYIEAAANNTISLQSGTSLFRSQDGSGPFPFPCSTRASAKQRRFDDINDTNDVDFGKNKTDCFGINFTACLS